MIILAHYCQDGKIHELADFIGDSLDLSRKAAATDAEVTKRLSLNKTDLIMAPKWVARLMVRVSQNRSINSTNSTDKVGTYLPGNLVEAAVWSDCSDQDYRQRAASGSALGTVV